MPSLDDATDWVCGSAGEAREGTSGQPTLVHFWSVSCGLCKESLPRVAEWRERLRAEGLRVIAVHMPRFPADLDVDAVREAALALGITEPCAVDNTHKLRDAFKNDHGFVPAYYLFDAEGKLRSFAAGERGLNVVATALDRTLVTARESRAAL